MQKTCATSADSASSSFFCHHGREVVWQMSPSDLPWWGWILCAAGAVVPIPATSCHRFYRPFVAVITKAGDIYIRMDHKGNAVSRG